MKIKKSYGELVEYDPEKVKRCIAKTGISSAKAEEVFKKVNARVREGMSTLELYSIVKKELAFGHPGIAARYDLRKALLRFGPAGFDFEKYVAAILRAYGYEVVMPPEDVQGACVSHEIDVIAEKDGRRIMIEAKFRHRYEDVVNIKDTMATWARFMDLVEGSRVNLCPHFDEVWIVTNAKFSGHALKYGHCKNMVLIGWNHPHERSFARMIDLSALYPISILSQIRDQDIKTLAQNNVLLCKELVDMPPPKLERLLSVKSQIATSMIKSCHEIIAGL